MKLFAKHIIYGLLTILGGLFLFMCLAICVGYIPYSDRPGPGWYNKPFGISSKEVYFILNFLIFLGIYILGSLIIVYFIFRLLRLVGYNKIVFSILGAITIGALSFYWTLGIGWYIALGSVPVYAGGIFGAVYGGFLFPRYLAPAPRISGTS